MSKRGSAFALASALVGALVLGGCHHEHLSSNYGQAYATWFAAQHVNRAPANPEQARRTLEGLDATEASMVSKSYRRASAKGDDNEAGRLLMISPNRGGNDQGGYIPPPSVPMSQ
jgi:hypothetical protein